MAKSKQRQEIEIKLPVRDLPALSARLKKLRTRKIVLRTYESNTLYDTPGQALRQHGQLIRIRTERSPASFRKKTLGKDSSAILTFKGPALSSSQVGKEADPGDLNSRYKIKEEAEIKVTSAGELARILEALGLQPGFRYEKFRTTYSLPGVPGVRIELDETPVGTYIELEGPIAAIDRAARLLGYSPEDYLTDSYGGLYAAACRLLGQKPGDMLFPPTKKSR